MENLGIQLVKFSKYSVLRDIQIIFSSFIGIHSFKLHIVMVFFIFQQNKKNLIYLSIIFLNQKIFKFLEYNYCAK